MRNWIDVCPCGCGAARVENPWVEKQKGNVVSSTDASHSHHLLSPVNGEKRKELCFIQRQRQKQTKASHFCHLLSRITGQKRRYKNHFSDIYVFIDSMDVKGTTV